MLVLRRGGGLATPLRISFDKEIRGFLAKAAPGMMASSAPQLLMVAGAIIASASPSAVSWLYFANRLIELPLGIVGVAMGTVLIPELTRAVRGGDHSAVAHAESRGLELAVGLALPATLGLMVLSEPIVRLLFEHGAFTSADTAATARALMWLTLALPAHVLVKALSPAFFAREDTVTPLLADAEGRGAGDRGRLPARPLVRRRRRCRGDCAGRVEHRARPDPPRRGELWLFDRHRRKAAAAAHRHGGARDGGAAVVCDTAPARASPRARTGWCRPSCC